MPAEMLRDGGDKMEREELTPHLNELKRVLKDKATDEEILKELNTFINEYGIDADATKKALLKKYGIAPEPNVKTFVTGNDVQKKIGELTGSEATVNILARVIFSEKKSITVRGSSKNVISGILGDETGTASFTVWEGDNCNLEKGAVYLFKNAYTKVWNDRMQINLGNRSVISKENVEIGVPERQISYSSSVVKISALKEGIGNVTVTGKIISLESKNTIVRGEEKTIFSGLIADETGKVQFSAWADFGLIEGDVVCVKNGYVRAWKGIPQLNFGDKSEVSKVDDTFGDIDTSTTSKKTVGEIIATGGGIDIEVTGLVVDLRSGSGLIKRCPQCNRSILGDECMTHGSIEPVMDLRMKVVIDDGSGAMSAIIGREITEKLTGITLDIATELSKARGESEIIAKSMAERILLKRVVLKGNVMSDDYGPMMIVKSANYDNINITAEAEKLLAAVEEVLM